MKPYRLSGAEPPPSHEEIMAVVDEAWRLCKERCDYSTETPSVYELITACNRLNVSKAVRTFVLKAHRDAHYPELLDPKGKS